eukprot:2717284-Alexandrium_andersonii.AAC.1
MTALRRAPCTRNSPPSSSAALLRNWVKSDATGVMSTAAGCKAGGELSWSSSAWSDATCSCACWWRACAVS